MTALTNIFALTADSDWHQHGAWWLPFGLLWIVLFAALIWFALRGGRRGPRPAADILAERFARGEIGSEEYRSRLEELRRHR
jgi:putative membrane protein